MILQMVLLTYLSYLQAQGFSTKLTFITNESFIIEDSANKILIDYDHRSTFNNKKYQNLQPPFDNIDLISISHIHDDHYNGFLTANYLRKNLECNVFMPSQVYESFKTDNDVLSINDRIMVLNQNNYECLDNHVLKDLYKHVKVPHAAGITDMENLMFVFSSGGIKFLHTGDYWGEDIQLIECDMLSEKIDIAIIHVKFITKGDFSNNIKLIKKYINPEYIFFMHIPIGSERMIEALNAQKELIDEFSNIYVFTQEMEDIMIKKENDIIVIE